MANRPRVVYTKIEHPKWRVSAHSSAINCLCVRSLTTPEGKPFARIYTGGEDGSMKIWTSKGGKILGTASGISGTAITSITYSNSMVCF